MSGAGALREACRVLGGLLLDGSNLQLLDELARTGGPRAAGGEVGGALGGALGRMQDALGGDREAAAVDFTRLFVTPAGDGRGVRLLVPPWEDCWIGPERTVMGERSRAALRAYAAAGLGFDGMRDRPADHIGLEILFVAALLDEEACGARDGGARRGFVREHLGAFAPAVGEALGRTAQTELWREAGGALRVLPEVVGE